MRDGDEELRAAWVEMRLETRMSTLTSQYEDGCTEVRIVRIARRPRAP